jgi:hypothetical protein
VQHNILLEDELTQEVTEETAQETLTIETTSFNKICNLSLILIYQRLLIAISRDWNQINGKGIENPLPLDRTLKLWNFTSWIIGSKQVLIMLRSLESHGLLIQNPPNFGLVTPVSFPINP